jgi:hypothetical protein
MRLQQQLQQLQEQYDSTVTTLHQTRANFLASEKKNHELELQLLQQRQPPPLPPSPPSPTPSAVTSPRGMEEQIEIQQLEGRVKYYQEELAEQRAQCQQLNEKIIRFNSELLDYKNRLGQKEKDFDEERRQQLEQQKMIEDLERKLKDLEEQQRQERRDEGFLRASQQQQTQRSKSQPLRSHHHADGLHLEETELRRDDENLVQLRGYFDETESSIAPEDDHLAPPHPQSRHRQSTQRSLQFSTQAITPQERSVAEIIASMLMEELEKLEMVAVRHRGHPERNSGDRKGGRGPDRGALEELSVKVALRLLWSARDREGQRMSLQELLSDQRFLSDLIADTQVSPPLPPS